MLIKKKRSWVNWVPGAVGIATFAGLIVFHTPILQYIADGTLRLTAMYSAIFDWAAIQTGFLFAVYGFIAGKPSGFLGAIKRTTAMANFNSYIRRATITGFLLTFASMPLIMFSLQPSTFGFNYLFVGSWLALFVWAFISFLRVAYLFGVIVKVPDHSEVSSR